MRVAATTTMLLAVVVACGGESSTPLGADELRVRAGAICDEARAGTEAAVPQPDQTAEEVADGLTRVAELYGDTVSALDDLEPPVDVEDSWDTWIAAQRDTADALERIGSAIREGDQGEVDRAARVAAERSAEADRLALELELPECTAPAATE